MKFVKGTESFPFKLSHKTSSWAHSSYSTHLFQSTFFTSPVKMVGCKENDADV